MPITEQTSDGDTTRTIKAKLRKAFPGATFSVTSGGVEQVKDVLIAAGWAEPWHTFDGKRALEIPGNTYANSICFDRYNVAERAASHEDLTRRSLEREAQQQRGLEAVRAAAAAKREALRAPARPLGASTDSPEAHATFEALRQRAEADVSTDAERQHRPNWAPPLILEGELLDSCIALGLLKPDDKPIARLWANFADPKKRGRVLREQRSHHSLSGIACRGFPTACRRRAGLRRLNSVEAQRTESGAWQFGPYVYTSDYYSPRRAEWERLVREREHCPDTYRGDPIKIDHCIVRTSEQIAAIDAKDLADAQAYHQRQALRVRAVELARARTLDFAGAPGVQMVLAGRLWGHCCNCGRALTDPISLERGIGPECHAGKVDFIKRMRAEMSVARLAFLTGVPEDFVVAVLADPRPEPKPATRGEFISTYITGGFEYLEFEGKFAVLNPEHTGFLSVHATQAELMAWIDEQRREKYAGRAG